MSAPPDDAKRRGTAVSVRAAFGRILLILAGIGVALATCELVARWRLGRPLPLEGDWLDLTMLGFRYGSYRIARDPHAVRIVGIGDSFAYGAVTPDSNYHHLVEVELTRRLRRPVEVINLGRPATGPAEQLVILRDLGLRFDPHAIVWTFFVGNDFEDALCTSPGEEPALEEILQCESWEAALRREQHEAWWRGLRTVSYVRFLATYLRGYGIPGAQPDPRRGTMGAGKFLETEKHRIGFLLNRERVTAAFDGAVEPRLRAAARMCRDAGIAFVLMVAPDQAEVERPLATDVLEALKGQAVSDTLDPAVLGRCASAGDLGPLVGAHKLLARFGTARGVLYVDLLQEFRRLGGEGDLYLKYDTHWNARGNQVAARMVVETLSSLPHSESMPARGGSQIH